MVIEPIWLLGQSVVMLGIGVGAYIRMTERVTKLEATVHTDLHDRVVALEAVLELLGKRAAKLLHSPHDPWGIDVFLDHYIANDYDLPDTEWESLSKKLKEVQQLGNTDAKVLAMLVETLAGFAQALAKHKMQRNNGVNKPPQITPSI